ncbi:MAG: integration host factor [Actinomycetes bacterium]|jgi:hypothetical protein|nr:integration host factor [Actinomycetes bacterium]
MALPQLSPEERKHFLEQAAKVRTARAKILADLKAGGLTVADVLAKADDDLYGKIKVLALIKALPGYGKAKAEALLDEIGISEKRRVKGLGKNQAAALLESLK